MLILVLLFDVFLIGVHSDPIWYNETAQEAQGKEVCMRELGCFAITEDFVSKHRPKNVLPNDRATINTKFLLYTRTNPREAHQLIASEKESFNETNFNPEGPTVFIVHGFMDSELYGPWMQSMRDEFLILAESKYNVIIVDWSGGNKLPYFQATANTRVVGAEIAILIQALERYKGISRENVHIIGHSLGAHIAGYAGERLKTLGRITGCDPAEPYFQNMPPSVRLDPTDADFVDVIHSDATDYTLSLGFGMSHKVGHVDFYPNSGRNQPGCNKDRFLKFITEGYREGARRFASCNHQRSLDFMHHSINFHKSLPVGYECTSWADFLDGKCAECGPDNKRCAVMGLRAIEYKEHRNSSVQHAMYLKTTGKAPFWLYHYQINVKLFKPRTAYKDVKGTFDVTLFGSKADELFHVLAKATDLYHGARYQYLVTTEKELGDIKSVSLRWFHASYNPKNWIWKPDLYVEYITVIPMNTIEQSPRKMTDRVFCGKPDRGIPPKTVANFHKDNSCIKFL